MEGIIFSDGSRVVYLPAGYYLISSDAEVTRVKTPEPEDSEHEEDSEEHHDQHPHHQEARDQSEDLGGQASEIYEWNDDGDAGVSDTPRPHDRHAADYPPLADMPSTPSGPYYMDEELENEEDVETTNAPPSNHPTLGCFTLPPQTYQAMALNQPNTRDKYVARGLLSDNLMSHIDAVPYDPFWIFHYGADLTVLTTFRSRMKMEVMFGKAVFRPGDVFRRVAVTGAILTETEAIVTSFPITINAYPEFQIRTTATGATSTVVACNGVGQLYDRMSAHQRANQQMPNQPAPGPRIFDTFRIFRNGQDLGTLADLRQALEIWIEERDLWSVRTTGHGRKRRSPNKKRRS